MSKIKKTISIIEAGGTGLEITEIYKKIIQTLYKGNVNFLSFKERFGYRPHTFLNLRDNFYNQDKAGLKKIIKKETTDLTEFYNLAQQKSVGMFRSAINAETLYYVRRNVKKLKAVILPIKTKGLDKRIIFIRDQLQGYYVNEKLMENPKSIDVNINFSRDNFLLLTRFTKDFLHKQKIKKFDLFYIYKYHLFGLELQKMIEWAVNETKIMPSGDFSIFQPDTGMHKLLGEISKIKNKDIVVVVGNEIGDVLLEVLIHYYNLATKETFSTLNVAFIDKSQPLEVLQTMHGSADDIAGKQLLNPIATIRSAAYALENWLNVPNAIQKMEKTIQKAMNEGFVTKDMGGNSKTSEVVEFILENY